MWKKKSTFQQFCAHVLSFNCIMYYDCTIMRKIIVVAFYPWCCNCLFIWIFLLFRFVINYAKLAKKIIEDIFPCMFPEVHVTGWACCSAQAHWLSAYCVLHSCKRLHDNKQSCQQATQPNKSLTYIFPIEQTISTYLNSWKTTFWYNKNRYNCNAVIDTFHNELN